MTVLVVGSLVIVNPGSASALTYPGGWQDVEQYQTVNGVEPSFIQAHQGPVGYRNGGCSGTLIGDGLYLTVAHCIGGGEANNFIRFNFQLNQGDELRPWDRYDVAQVLEDNPDAPTFGAQDHGLLRLTGNPENEYGFATMEARQPDVTEPLVIIGHPGIPIADSASHTSFKTAAVPSIKCLSGGTEETGPNDITYSGVSIYGGSSGAGVWDPATGRLIGVNRASGRGSPTECQGGSGRGNTIQRHQLVSDWLDTDHGSARMYTFAADGLTQFNWKRTDWRSSWHHIVPGNYRGLATQELFFYDSQNGDAQFYTVGANGPVRLGPRHTGLNAPDSPWGQIVPVQIDSTPEQELMFLNTRTGSYRFYRTNGSGSLELLPPPGGRNRVPILGPGGTAPRLATGGDFATRAGDEITLHFPLEGLVQSFGTTPDGALEALPGEVSGLPAGSIMLTGEFRAASERQEVLLYDPEAEHLRMIWFTDDGTASAIGPVFLPGGRATQIATGNFTSGTSNLMVFQPSATNDYANAAENTATMRLFDVADNLSLTPGEVEGGYRRSISKFIVGDFLADNAPSAIMYDRYRL